MLTQVLLPNRQQQCGTGEPHTLQVKCRPLHPMTGAPMSSAAEGSSPGPAQHHAAVQTFPPPFQLNDVTCC